MASSPPPAPPQAAAAATPASTVPMKRALEDDHAPSVSSPLNPDPKPRPVQREQREKKDSLKKREAAGLTAAPAVVKSAKGKPGVNLTSSEPTLAPSPVRYNHSLPREAYHYTAKDTVLYSKEPEPAFVDTEKGSVELKRPNDSTENKKVYRYTHCIADPAFPHSRYYRVTDDTPYGARMSFTDSDKLIHFDDSARIVTNEKGWRMSRANVCAREGSFYFEVKILRGVPREGPPVPAERSGHPLPHVRVGWSRREASLDAPVGFDGYSYGLSDIRMEPMHKSRASKFLDNGVDTSAQQKKLKLPAKNGKLPTNISTTFAANDHAREGDVVGMLITLPSLSLQRKIVDGIYNPAVDTGDGLDAAAGDDEGAPNIVRDRFPVPYKGAMYFETMEYRASKGMESYGDRGPFAKETPGPNNEDPTLRSLPHSSIKVFKNGKMIGTAFRDLMAFLPPASIAERGKDAKESYDDGIVGYYPTVALFSGGAAEINCGPDFWYPPSGLKVGTIDQASLPVSGEEEELVKQEQEAESGEDTVMAGTEMNGTAAASTTTTTGTRPKIRAIGERYAEQIAEDIMYDLVDEVDFYIQDDGDANKVHS